MAFGARVTAAEDGTLTKEDGTILNGIMDVALAPVSLFSDGDKYVSASTNAMTAVAWGLGGLFVGDRYGHKIPVIGGGQRS